MPVRDNGQCAHRPKPVPAGWQQRHITVGARERAYEVYIPPAYHRGTDAYPIVLGGPGSGQSATGFAEMTNLAAAADRFSYLAVTLQGVDDELNVEANCTADPTGPDDIEYVTAILDRLEAELCVDTARIHATGFSRGARFVSRLASELSSRVASIAPVGGVRFPSPNGASRPVPIFTIHGLSDPTNPFDGGGRHYWQTGVLAALEEWARFNGCAAHSRVAYPPPPPVPGLAAPPPAIVNVTLHGLVPVGHAHAHAPHERVRAQHPPPDPGADVAAAMALASAAVEAAAAGAAASEAVTSLGPGGALGASEALDPLATLDWDAPDLADGSGRLHAPHNRTHFNRTRVHERAEREPREPFAPTHVHTSHKHIHGDHDPRHRRLAEAREPEPAGRRAGGAAHDGPHHRRRLVHVSRRGGGGGADADADKGSADGAASSGQVALAGEWGAEPFPPITLERWTGCARGADVTLFAVRELRHRWPLALTLGGHLGAFHGGALGGRHGAGRALSAAQHGGGPIVQTWPDNVDASALIFDFLEAHPLTGGGGGRAGGGVGTTGAAGAGGGEAGLAAAGSDGLVGVIAAMGVLLLCCLVVVVALLLRGRSGGGSGGKKKEDAPKASKGGDGGDGGGGKAGKDGGKAGAAAAKAAAARPKLVTPSKERPPLRNADGSCAAAAAATYVDKATAKSAGRENGSGAFTERSAPPPRPACAAGGYARLVDEDAAGFDRYTDLEQGGGGYAGGYADRAAPPPAQANGGARSAADGAGGQNSVAIAWRTGTAALCAFRPGTAAAAVPPAKPQGGGSGGSRPPSAPRSPRSPSSPRSPRSPKRSSSFACAPSHGPPHEPTSPLERRVAAAGGGFCGGVSLHGGGGGGGGSGGGSRRCSGSGGTLFGALAASQPGPANTCNGSSASGGSSSRDRAKSPGASSAGRTSNGGSSGRAASNGRAGSAPRPPWSPGGRAALREPSPAASPRRAAAAAARARSPAAAAAEDAARAEAWARVARERASSGGSRPQSPRSPRGGAEYASSSAGAGKTKKKSGAAGAGSSGSGGSVEHLSPARTRRAAAGDGVGARTPQSAVQERLRQLRAERTEAMRAAYVPPLPRSAPGGRIGRGGDGGDVDGYGKRYADADADGHAHPSYGYGSGGYPTSPTSKTSKRCTHDDATTAGSRGGSSHAPPGERGYDFDAALIALRAASALNRSRAARTVTSLGGTPIAQHAPPTERDYEMARDAVRAARVARQSPSSKAL